MPAAVDRELRVQAVALVAAGQTCRQVARKLSVGDQSVGRWVKAAGMVMQIGPIGGVRELRGVARKPEVLPEGDYLDGNGRLTLVARVVIDIRLREGRNYNQIADELGVHRSTVGAEVKAATVDGRYRARKAQLRSQLARRRPKVGKLGAGTLLREQVKDGLNLKLSPEQISGRLRLEFGDRDDMQVSHETIYQALYVQGAGSLRHELAVENALRQRRTKRRPQSKLAARPGRSWIGEATISARPAEVADRAVPGHWEGDLVIGGDQKSALVTLFERTSRFTLIGRITVHDAVTVTDRLTFMAERLPKTIWRSLTWDQGCEMAGHARFTVATDCPVFFCDPHSPWQRPTNENGNGLIREFFPKGTDFTKVTDDQVTEAEHLLNIRPRKILGFATPAERLDELLTVASTP